MYVLSHFWLLVTAEKNYLHSAEVSSLQLFFSQPFKYKNLPKLHLNTRDGTLIVANIYLQLIQNRYMFRSFTVLQCSHQHCVQPVASDVEVVGYL